MQGGVLRKGQHTELRAEWLTYEQAIALTSLGRSTLQALVLDGDILASRVGRVVRINRADLERYLYDHAVSSAGEPRGDVAPSEAQARQKMPA